MSANQVDIDTETILFDGRWLGREDLARNIKAMLDGGNYNIGKQSAALEALNAALSDVRTVAFRASPELAGSVSEIASKLGRTPGALIREALAQYLAASRAGNTPPMSEPKKGEPAGRRPTEPEMPAVVLDSGMTQRMAVVTSSSPAVDVAPAPAPSISEEPKTPPAPPPGLRPAASLIAGPGALRSAGLAPAPSVVVDGTLTPSGYHMVVTESASPEEKAGAVDLKPKLKEGETPEAVERRWFGG